MELLLTKNQENTSILFCEKKKGYKNVYNWNTKVDLSVVLYYDIGSIKEKGL